ncbi:MAG TPA: hypothetical protein VF551_05975, partial [Chthoniobacterales bacterium]
MRGLTLGRFLLGLAACPSLSLAQLPTAPGDAVRVTVSQNQDGSRTSYEVDPANRRATATTTSREGKLMGKIRYTLDDAGRFATGEVLGPDAQFRYKT